ncbi:MAG: hypothetical protein BGO98_17565 [Myxococcales bacterium 68-20]|nr:PAS domain S-box protein [Myxococcales bacterium]OJY23756.1 MAG: hypothetical protein BGO98_17565 [Myxococcales bacterium 68-20]
MPQHTGAAAARPAIGILVWSNGDEPDVPLLGAIGEAGFAPRIVTGSEDLVLLVSDDPDAVVLLDATTSLDEALAACRRIRQLPEGARTTICLASSKRGADDEVDAIEAGADAFWNASVRANVVRAFVARAKQRAKRAAPASGEVRRTTKRSSRVQVTDQAERQFRALFDNALDLVAIIDESGVVQVANAAVRTVLGRVPEDLAGSSVWDLMHPEDVALARQAHAEALAASGVGAPTTIRARHGDGSWVTLEITERNLLADPAVGGILFYGRDVTERIWVGAALQESELRFREIFENMLDGVVQIDEETRSLVQANPAFCQIVGRTRHEVFGLSLLDLFASDDRDALERVLDEHFTGRRRVSDTLRVRHKDGTLRYVDFGTSRIELSGARPIIAVVRDVTARRETERTREMFLAVVAHELRTPVAVLRNGIEILRSKIGSLPVGDRDTLMGVLTEEVERLTRLVGDALDVGAIQSGSLALRPHRVALAPIVASVAARVGPQFRTSATLDLEATDAWVDPLRFEQVLTNLLDNAWRHCGSSTSVNVTLAIEDAFARISVIDDGPGFPPELQSGLFERVFVPNGSPTCGIGIGLWLSKRLVESMGGEIAAHAGNGGRGACVTFTVPRS